MVARKVSRLSEGRLQPASLWADRPVELMLPLRGVCLPMLAEQRLWAITVMTLLDSTCLCGLVYGKRLVHGLQLHCTRQAADGTTPGNAGTLPAAAQCCIVAGTAERPYDACVTTLCLPF